jgi:CPA2 family monovalent cation:H+ antiporter-2
VPVQQVFTVLFFVSVGMLFDPGVVVRAPLHVAGIAAVVVIGNPLITLIALLALRAAPRGAAEVAAALAQIGEFSFILSAIAVAQGLLPPEARNLVLAAAVLSIVLQPAMLRGAAVAGNGLDKLGFLRRWHASRSAQSSIGATPDFNQHAIVVGHGRVGSRVVATLREEGAPYVVIEQNLHAAECCAAKGCRLSMAMRPGPRCSTLRTPRRHGSW